MTLNLSCIFSSCFPLISFFFFFPWNLLLSDEDMHLRVVDGSSHLRFPKLTSMINCYCWHWLRPK